MSAPAKARAPARGPVRLPPRLAVLVTCTECAARLHLGPLLCLREGTVVVAGMEGWRGLVAGRRYGTFSGLCAACLARPDEVARGR